VLDQAQVSVAAAFPAFRDVAIAEGWAGLINVTPGAVPAISPVDSLPGFFIATGFPDTASASGPASASRLRIW
jgi:glycine/D-amino acid oxidase-like deaminating enzyme